jgi:thiol:disulfide interchange protein DsbC
MQRTEKLMKNFFKFVVIIWLAMASLSVAANEASIKKAIENAMPGATVGAIKPSEIKGVFEVIIGASVYYISEDGKYLLQGRLIDLLNKVDLTEQKMSSTRKAALEKLGADKMIVFKPKIGKYKVFVFTDIDCGYCRKLHSEIDQYLAEGIQINYLFFPRAGKGSDSYHKAVSVWCAKDRNAALTDAKKDGKIDNKTCENPVDEHMRLAAEFDAKGTPLIVTENGNSFPGYLPAKQLLEALQNEKTAP